MEKDLEKRLCTQKNEVKKNESRNQFVAEESFIMTEVGTLVYSAPEEVEIGIVIIFR